MLLYISLQYHFLCESEQSHLILCMSDLVCFFALFLVWSKTYKYILLIYSFNNDLHIFASEIFSIPSLSIHPGEVFEGEHFDIRCQISSLASRIQREDIKYSIFRDDTFVIKDNRYSGTASKATNGKYVCKAEANGIIKESSMLLFGAKGSTYQLCLEN